MESSILQGDEKMTCRNEAKVDSHRWDPKVSFAGCHLLVPWQVSLHWRGHGLTLRLSGDEHGHV